MNSILTDFEKYAYSGKVSETSLKKYMGAISPVIVEEREMNSSIIDVFSRLMRDRIIFLGTEINSDVANIITSQMMYLDSVDLSPIKLFINSPGGSVIDGLAIYDIMHWVKTPVETYCMGMAASMGAVLLSSGTKGKRYSLPHGEIMIHQPSGGTGRVQAADMKIAYQQMERCKTTLYKILSENTGKTIEEIERDADRDFWMTGEDAKTYGIIDDIVKRK